MTEQKTQVQRAFEKLQEACPKEWVICQQQVLIEDLQAQVADQADTTPQAG